MRVRVRVMIRVRIRVRVGVGVRHISSFLVFRSISARVRVMEIKEIARVRDM
jgi:hypothetical protein